MLNTIVRQTCTTLLLPDSVPVYQIVVDVLDAGDLPHPNLFVFQILDTADATRDTFVRVGSPYDLETLPTTRATAVTGRKEYYLRSSLIKRYSDLEVAVQARDAVRSRVDNSVNAWHQYKTEFEGVTDYEHPTAEAAYEEQLKEAYEEAKAERLAAENVVQAAGAELTAAQRAAEDAVDLSNKYKAALDFSDQAYGVYWQAYYPGTESFADAAEARFAALRTQFNDITGQPYVSTGAYSSYTPFSAVTVGNAFLSQLQLLEAAITAYSTPRTQGPPLDSALSNYHVQALGTYSGQQGAVATANAQAAQAVTAKKEAEASLQYAQAAEDAALAAVRSVCPSFTPTST